MVVNPIPAKPAGLPPGLVIPPEIDPSTLEWVTDSRLKTLMASLEEPIHYALVIGGMSGQFIGKLSIPKRTASNGYTCQKHLQVDHGCRHGDSGSPVLFIDGNRYFILGIVRAGDDDATIVVPIWNIYNAVKHCQKALFNRFTQCSDDGASQSADLGQRFDDTLRRTYTVAFPAGIVDLTAYKR